MEQLKNSINWFEIPVSDFNRAKKFYETIYDFEMPEHQMGQVQMGFLLCDTQSGEEIVGGAICFGEGYTPSEEGTKIYLNGGRDLNTVLNRIESAGGKVTLSKTEIPENHGFFASFIDTEGNLLYLHSNQ